MHTDEEKAGTADTFLDWTRRIGTYVAALRTERQMSAQQVADQTRELGYEVTRSTIANLESGRKESVSIVEIAMLAAALEVAPVRLLFDVREHEVAALPDQTTSAVRAIDWWSALAPAPGSAEADHPSTEYAGPVELVRSYDGAVKAIVAFESVRHTHGADDPDIQRLESELRAALMARLETAHLAMTAAGLAPPPIKPQFKLWIVAPSKDA
jgi:transcriptional regulator with XRE-family HTH domain